MVSISVHKENPAGNVCVVLVLVVLDIVEVGGGGVGGLEQGPAIVGHTAAVVTKAH